MGLDGIKLRRGYREKECAFKLGELRNTLGCDQLNEMILDIRRKQRIMPKKSLRTTVEFVNPGLERGFSMKQKFTAKHLAKR
ncbi:MAG: hypothetical protein DMF73_04305 [Acidobacteria bacterium]|nr:MAG: hypothetical protein DMF73_04305 [Acidobacteriota bacterium]